MRPSLWLACIVLASSGAAGAQGVYKCTGADGKVAFGDAPCAGDAKAPPGREAPKGGLALEEAARRAGVSTSWVQRLRSECEDDGDASSCIYIDAIRAQPPKLTAKQIAERHREREERVRELQAGCAKGEDMECLVLVHWQAFTPEQEREAVERHVKRLCAAGKDRACDQLIRGVVADPSAIANARPRCDKGDTGSCRLLDTYKLLGNDPRLALKRRCGQTFMDACAELRGERLR